MPRQLNWARKYPSANFDNATWYKKLHKTNSTYVKMCPHISSFMHRQIVCSLPLTSLWAISNFWTIEFDKLDPIADKHTESTV